MIKDDPTIDQIRKIRHQISQRFDHDPKKVVEYYIRLQKQFQGRLLDLSEKWDMAENAQEAETGK